MLNLIIFKTNTMKLLKYSALLLLIAMFSSSCQPAEHLNSMYVLSTVLIILDIVLFVFLALYSNILRDEVSNRVEFDENAVKIQRQQKRKLVNKTDPFSLTKVQFGVWTVIISSSYLYLSITKGDCSGTPINKTALVLMGIFAGTAVASSIMDKNEMNDNRPRHQNSPSQGFFIDLLSDDNGISLHRFQNFIWTLIAMTVYIYKVYNVNSGCVLPELSDTLLALTGISSATYLVLRSKENDPSIQEAQDNADASANNTITPSAQSPSSRTVTSVSSS